MQQRPDEPLLTFLESGTGDGVTWTLADLDREAGRVAALLRGSVAQGAPVMLMASPGLEYVAGFYGCMYAGCIPVPAYPPSPFHARENMKRLQAVIANAGATVGLTTDAVLPALQDLIPDTPFRWITMSDSSGSGDRAEPTHGGHTDDVAFLQYTSGSTGEPKGVMVTQGNLLTNSLMTAEVFGVPHGVVMVSWLPPYHDMGLIGTLLNSPIWRTHTVFMPPAVFLRRPVRWLQVVSRYEAFISPAPNFAFDTCVAKIKDADLADVDLSSWRVAVNGAEPVRAATVERFQERFGPYGFAATSMRPSYGLAEATLLVTGTTADGPTVLEVDSEALSDGTLRRAEAGQASQRVVSSGVLPEGGQVTIADESTGESLPEGAVGEILVSGPTVAAGYWGSAEETRARFTGDTVRTGDLGALIDGHLVVTGRAKDVLIIRGRNFYPSDIESTVEDANPTFRKGCGAAFTVERDERELLVVVQEVNPGLVETMGSVVQDIREAVTSTHGIAASAVVLIRPGAVPKTSSGKVRRSEARRRYLEGDLQPVWAWESGQPIEPAATGA